MSTLAHPDANTADDRILASGQIHVPTELIMKILEEAFYKTKLQRQPDYQTLTAAALVHRSWTDIAQTLVFRHVSYTHSRMFRDSFLITGPMTARIRALLTQVRVIDMGLGLSNEKDCNADCLSILLSRCPHVYELTLRIHAAAPLKDVPFYALKQVVETTSFNLRALQILESSAMCPILYQLLPLFSSIQFLIIGSEISGPPPRNIQPTFQLYELDLYRSPTPVVLKWLLGSSAGTLRILEMRDPPDIRIKQILEPHLANLRSLRLMAYNSHCAEIVRLCLHLEELRIFHVPNFIPFQDLPPTIEHLSFINYNFSRSLVRRIADVIPALPRLRLLSFDQDSQDDPSFPDLESVCNARNVSIDPSAAVMWRAEDAVFVERFPRRRSISNFNYMHPEHS